MNLYHAGLVAGWALFAFLHSALASISFKRFLEKRLGDNFKYYRFFYSLFAAINLALLLVYQYSHESFLLFRPDWELVAAAGVFAAAGITVMLVSGRKYLAAISGTAVFRSKDATPKLEQEGLHRYVRHPIYSGTLLTIWAFFIIYPYLNNLIACVVITGYTLIGMVLEERKLVLEFGDTYVNYARRTPRLLPLIGSRPQDEKQ